jgi:prepilin-type N-terminal cleavage/methylation domain-containing protein
MRNTQRGFTLLEIMLVLGLVALLTGSVVVGFRSYAKSELRGGAAKLAGAIRYLFDRASTTGKVHRLVFDFEEGKYWAEVSDDRFFMPRERETDESRRRTPRTSPRRRKRRRRPPSAGQAARIANTTSTPAATSRRSGSPSGPSSTCSRSRR